MRAQYRLARVVRENHNGAILHVAFHPDKTNVVASVGANQINLYDNEHLGNHFDLYVHYVNGDPAVAPSPDEPSSQGFHTLAWIGTEKNSEDILVAAADASPIVQVLSVLRREVIAELDGGHKGPVTALAGSAALPGLLFVGGSDKRLCVWDIISGTKIAHRSVPACTLALSVKGKSLAVGGVGNVSILPVGNKRDVEAKFSSSPIEKIPLEQSHDVVQHMEWIDDKHLVCLTSGSRLVRIDAAKKRIAGKVQVPDCRNHVNRFGMSPERDRCCVGDSKGAVYIYSTDTLEQVAVLEHRRCSKPVTSCCLAKNSVIASTGDLLWRWDRVAAGAEGEPERSADAAA